ncbi:hypothetical protein ACWEO6_33825, partial [Streptomyces sp. NPDC004291]
IRIAPTETASGQQDPAATRYIPIVTGADNAIAPTYRLDSRSRQSASLPVWMGASEQMSARSLATVGVQAWDAQKNRELDQTGTVSPSTKAALAQAFVAQRDSGEAVGQYAGKQYMDVNYPTDKFDVKPLGDHDNTSSGAFDKVYAVTDRLTQRTTIVILEEKGPRAELGARVGLDGKYYTQGARGYYDSIVDNMAKNGTKAEKDLADQLLLTDLGDIEYVLVRAKVAEEKADGVTDQRYDGYTSIAFNLRG